MSKKKFSLSTIIYLNFVIIGLLGLFLLMVLCLPEMSLDDLDFDHNLEVAKRLMYQYKNSVEDFIKNIISQINLTMTPH